MAAVPWGSEAGASTPHCSRFESVASPPVQVPISVVDVGEDEERLVLEVLRSGMLAQGPMVQRLEALVAGIAGVPHAVAVNNGTTALVAALQALGLQPGDEVVTSPFTFVATLNAILEAGATARFADIRPDDFAVDADAVAAAVGPRTRVLMPVHLYGQAADMGRLMPVAEQHGLAVVEDAAQAIGAAFGDRACGSFGVGCFSLYATKNVATGEGGVITTADDAVADRLRLLRNQGMRVRYQYEVPGHNYRMTDLQAAVGVPQLERLGTLTARRQANAAYLREHLAGLPGVRLPDALPGRVHVWHQFTLLLEEGCPVTRDELAAALTAEGVGNGFYYPRTVFDYDCYRNRPDVVIDDVPEASRIAANVISIPVHPKLTPEQLSHVVGAVRRAVGG